MYSISPQKDRRAPLQSCQTHRGSSVTETSIVVSFCSPLRDVEYPHRQVFLARSAGSLENKEVEFSVRAKECERKGIDKKRRREAGSFKGRNVEGKKLKVPSRPGSPVTRATLAESLA